MTQIINFAGRADFFYLVWYLFSLSLLNLFFCKQIWPTTPTTCRGWISWPINDCIQYLTPLAHPRVIIILTSRTLVFCIPTSFTLKTLISARTRIVFKPTTFTFPFAAETIILWDWIIRNLSNWLGHISQDRLLKCVHKASRTNRWHNISLNTKPIYVVTLATLPVFGHLLLLRRLLIGLVTKIISLFSCIWFSWRVISRTWHKQSTNIINRSKPFYIFAAIRTALRKLLNFRTSWTIPITLNFLLVDFSKLFHREVHSYIALSI